MLSARGSGISAVSDSARGVLPSLRIERRKYGAPCSVRPDFAGSGRCESADMEPRLCRIDSALGRVTECPREACAFWSDNACVLCGGRAWIWRPRLVSRSCCSGSGSGWAGSGSTTRCFRPGSDRSGAGADERSEAMKALVYHGPGKRSWEDVPDPVIVDPTDAIVRIDSSTICGTRPAHPQGRRARGAARHDSRP